MYTATLSREMNIELLRTVKIYLSIRDKLQIFKELAIVTKNRFLVILIIKTNSTCLHKRNLKNISKFKPYKK